MSGTAPRVSFTLLVLIIFKKYFTMIQVFDILIDLTNFHTKLNQSVCIILFLTKVRQQFSRPKHSYTLINTNTLINIFRDFSCKSYTINKLSVNCQLSMTVKHCLLHKHNQSCSIYMFQSSVCGLNSETCPTVIKLFLALVTISICYIAKARYQVQK